MKKLKDSQWRDLEHRIVNCRCPFCGYQSLQSNPRYATLGDIETLSVSCSNCGHLVFFDVDELQRRADEVDRKLREKGNR